MGLICFVIFYFSLLKIKKNSKNVFFFMFGFIIEIWEKTKISHIIKISQILLYL